VETITIDVWLYGELARYGREAAPKSYANRAVELPAGSQLQDLLEHLALPTAQRGITFVNGTLSAMPNLQPDLDLPLADGDRVAFFDLKSMWPAQYRDGAALADNLARIMDRRKGLLHHTPEQGEA
jgi:hypothetical protein